MRRILLLLEHKENRRLLSQWLGTHYEIVVPDVVVEKSLIAVGVSKLPQSESSPPFDMASLLNQSFDLCIIDGLALDRLWQRVEARKETELPVFLPFLLVTSRQEVNIMTRHLWRSVDELIISPIEKVELQARVEMLLRSRQLSLKLQTANGRLKELHEIKSRFVSIVSHEFRNLLHAISASTQILERYSDSFSPNKKQEFFTRVKTSVKKMTDLIDDVLAIRKVEDGKLKFSPSLLNLEKLCNELTLEMLLSTGQTNKIIFESQGECPDAEVDEKILRHILTNLLSNAIKYSPRGSNVYFKLLYKEGEAVFEIKDEGIGIPPEDQQKLFGSFHRATNVSSIPGSGLGLVIVKQYVDLHGGKIAFTSKVGVGSTFTVTLPFSRIQVTSCDI